jgi:hypothetical protein
VFDPVPDLGRESAQQDRRQGESGPGVGRKEDRDLRICRGTTGFGWKNGEYGLFPALFWCEGFQAVQD